MNKLQYINDTYVGIDPMAKTVRFRIENWRPYEPCSKLKIKKNICTYIKIERYINILIDRYGSERKREKARERERKREIQRKKDRKRERERARCALKKIIGKLHETAR